jgi:hypothetical protein
MQAGLIMSSTVRNRRSSPSNRPSLVRTLMNRPRMISSSGARTVVYVLIVAGAVLTVLSGLLHLKLWGGPTGYHLVPTIGPLFLVQAIAGVALGLILLVTMRLFMVLACLGLMAGTAVGLILTVQVGLFGFQENWGAPYAKTSLVLELVGAAILLIAAIPLALARRT